MDRYREWDARLRPEKDEDPAAKSSGTGKTVRSGRVREFVKKEELVDSKGEPMDTPETDLERQPTPSLAPD